MKPIERLNNVEKAKLLFELFPAEIPAFITFLQSMCTVIQQDENMNRRSWNEKNLITFDFWLGLVKDIDRVLTKYGEKITKHSSLFADQLFDGYKSIFTTHCLVQYVKERTHPNNKFAQAIELLFFTPIQ